MLFIINTLIQQPVGLNFINILIGVAIIASPFIINKIWKNKLSIRVKELTGQEEKVKGAFVVGQNNVSGSGYLTFTNESLVFIELTSDSTYVFKFDDITGYSIGGEASGAYGVIGNVVVPGVNDIITIGLSNGSAYKWRNARVNLVSMKKFQKALVKVLGTNIDEFKIA